MKYKVLSLFSGSGGLDLGFIQTNMFEVVLANDINPNACETYRANIGEHILCQDIRDLSDLPEVDVLIGGPPCQGFSTANPNRAFDDERNWLFKEYKRILLQTQPRVFLMENVSGMMTLEKGTVFELIKSELTEAGYRIQTKVLNAVDYGVPQSRRRVIIVGVRNDIAQEYFFPPPKVVPPLFGQFSTVGDAFSSQINTNNPNHSVSKLTDLNQERLKHIPQGGSMVDCPEELRNNSDLKRAMRRLSMDKPSYTIVHNNCDHYYHPTESRRVTIREMARLQGYPDDFIFYGSKSEQSRQVANSVPVLLGQHLAQSVADFLTHYEKGKACVNLLRA